MKTSKTISRNTALIVACALVLTIIVLGLVASTQHNKAKSYQAKVKTLRINNKELQKVKTIQPLTEQKKEPVDISKEKTLLASGNNNSKTN